MNPKAGKSSLAYALFGSKGLFLGFENGTRALSGAMAIPVNEWEDITRDKKIKDEDGNSTKKPSINKQLKMSAVKERFEVLIIDTADLMYQRIIEFVCAEEGVDDILDIPFGKGYSKADEIFSNQLIEWEKMGYRLFFISHAEDKKLNVKDHKGIERETSKFVPTAHKRAFKIVSKMVDNIFFAYVKNLEDGSEERVVFTRETNTYFAGSRFHHLPSELPLNAKEIEKAISEAIEKEDLTTDDKAINTSLNVGGEFESFAEIKANVISLVKSVFKAKDRMDIVTEVITKHLGEGATIGGATEECIDGMDAVLEELTAKSKEIE